MLKYRNCALCLSMQAALDYLIAHDNVDSNHLIVYGHSLGASVALHLTKANLDRVSGLVMENPFLSLVQN